MNNEIFYFFYSFAHQSVFIDNLIIFLAHWFPWLVIFFAVIFLLFHHEVFVVEKPFRALVQKWKEIILVFFSGISAWCVAQILKFLIYTNRPFLEFQDITPLLLKNDFSFPSGHATFFMALAFAIFFSHKKIGYIFMFFAFLIGIARIMAGVHFPIDILGGFILGIATAYFVKYTASLFVDKLQL